MSPGAFTALKIFLINDSILKSAIALFRDLFLPFDIFTWKHHKYYGARNVIPIFSGKIFALKRFMLVWVSEKQTQIIIFYSQFGMPSLNHRKLCMRGLTEMCFRKCFVAGKKIEFIWQISHNYSRDDDIKKRLILVYFSRFRKQKFEIVD